MEIWGVLSVILALISLAVSQPPLEWTPENYPNPRLEPARCGRPYVNASWVCDPNGLITVEEANVLDYIIDGIVKTDTPCPCSAFECERNRKGYFISIALMNKIKKHPKAPNSKEGSANAAFKFAYELNHKKWAFGNCRQSVLILLSKEDDILYTVTGGTARAVLTDPLVVKISSDARRFMEPGEDMSVALKSMVISFKKVFRNEYYDFATQDDYTAIGGTTAVYSGGLVYYISSLIASLFLVWLLHG